MKVSRITAVVMAALFLLQGKSFAQIEDKDSVKLDYRKIYSFCLDANIKPVFALLEYDPGKKISAKDQLFRKNFNERFKYGSDQNHLLASKGSSIDSLLSIFQHYWRGSLLDSANSYDSILWHTLHVFLKNDYPALKAMPYNIDSADAYAKMYIANKGLYMTDGIGKTGKLFDLLVWKSQKDTTYHFTLHHETTSARVIFMNDFITLGWEEYATLGRYYPGGWATSGALYCVRSAYDLKSENFLVSYLAHESRHFADYKLFPKLTSADLEYRAKLVELSLAKQSLYGLVNFFIDNANYDSDNGHSVADYCVIRDLSRAIFKTEFEKDKTRWSKIGSKKINAAADKILQVNTKELMLKGKEVEKYIKL
ncbi:MAG: hypothetical protein ABJA78_20605 [Ferruginibacter sp.]